jgi:hypothetical protein
MALSLEENEIIKKLNEFAKNISLPREIEEFIKCHTKYFNTAAFYLKDDENKKDSATYFIDIEKQLCDDL